MTIGVAGNYLLRLKFGDVSIPLDPSVIEEFTITQDMHSFLPSVRMMLKDSSGALSHIVPFDKRMSRASVQFNLFSEDLGELSNAMDFMVYSRQPESIYMSSMNYEILGLMDIPELLSPDKNRVFTGTVLSTLETIAEELEVDETELPQTALSYSRTLVQPSWPNSRFLTYLTRKLAGKNGEYAFQCFIKAKREKSVLVFRALNSLMSDGVRYNFIIGDKEFRDPDTGEFFFPVYHHMIYDNYRVLGLFGGQQQNYSYYDFDDGEYVTKQRTLDEFLSISDYFQIDLDDDGGGHTLEFLGRTNDLDVDFEGRSGAHYFNRIVGLSKLWIVTMGLPNITPGDIIKLFFPSADSPQLVLSHQYSGLWMVERVVHSFGNTFRSRILLTRNGPDTDQQTTLVPAAKRRF